MQYISNTDPEACLNEENIPFSIVDSLVSWSLEGRLLKLVCSTRSCLHKTYWSHETPLRKMQPEKDRESSMVFHVFFWSKDVFRIQFNAGEEALEPLDLRNLPAAMVAGLPENDVLLQAAEDKDMLRIRSGNITFEVAKSPFRCAARDSGGRIFWSQKEYETVQEYTSDSFRTAAAGFNGILNCFESLDLKNDECIYGLGERFDSVERKGIPTDFWNKDAAGTTGRRTYINIPFFWSTRGYGLFLNNYGKTRWEMGTRDTATLCFGVQDDYMDYFVLYGPEPKRILFNYCKITGFSPVPPVWTFGLWMSRNSYMSWDIVNQVAAELREREIPADVLHLDSAWFKKDLNCDLRFCRQRFPDPEGNMARLRQQGFRVSLWQWNYVVPDEENPNFIEGREKGYFAAGPQGGIFSFPEYVQGIWTDHGVIDFSNPEAAGWYTRQIRSLIKMGASAIKTDFGEGIPEDALYQKMDGKKFHNYYSLLYNHLIYEAIKAESHEATVWARSGTAGSQRYPIHWCGDSQSTWSGLAGTLKGILSAGLSGIAFISHDIGGFIGRPSPELYIRWAQLGLFSSHSRCHGMGNSNSREPWSFGEEACGIFKKFDRLRYRLLPYIYGQAQKSARAGLPFVRPLVLEYPRDPNVRFMEDQYLFGEDLLVAPILAPADEQPVRPVYLPAGQWVDFWTGKVIDSRGQWIDAANRLDIMPVFVKATGILPYGGDRLFTGNSVGDLKGLEIYPSASGEWTHDDGENSLTIKISGDAVELINWNKQSPLDIYCMGCRRIIPPEEEKLVLHLERNLVGNIS